MCNVAECADWMASTFTARNTASAITTCREKLRKHFEIDSGQAESLLLRSSDAVNEAASAMGMALKENISFESVMQNANRKLAEENLSYQDLVWKLEQTITERDQLAAEIQDDLELAREIQQGLLPKQTNHDFPVCAINLSAREVSGDFFDFFTLADGRIYFNIADVSGKGMNAALLMAKTSSLFRCLGKAIHSPAKLLAMINTELVETSIRGRFVTLVAGVYDPKTRKAIIVNAGHLPIIHLKKNGEHVFIPAKDSPLGITDGISFTETTIELGSGKLVMYTDGVTECYNRGRTTLSDKAILQLFDKLMHANADSMETELLKLLNLQKDTLTDDLSILVIR
jgi:serine phosphatase RsbU (regulator of sigma subunit)